MIIDSHWFALCLSQGPVRLDGVTYYLRNGRVCVRPSHHKKRGKRSEAELATTGRFVEMRKLWTMYLRAVGELPVWRVAGRGVGGGQGDTLCRRVNAGGVCGGGVFFPPPDSMKQGQGCTDKMVHPCPCLFILSIYAYNCIYAYSFICLHCLYAMRYYT